MSAIQPITKTMETDHKHHLLKNAVGFLGILFMVVASAAPLVVVAGYIPISIGLGSGIATPITYLLVTLILLVFSIGYVEMAKRITSAGAFYSFVSQGLGRPLGLAAGFGSVFCYSLIEAAIIGGVGFYGADLFHKLFGIEASWLWFSIGAILLNNILSFFKVTLTAKILGILLTLEMLAILIVNIATIAAGGSEGLSIAPLNPSEMFIAPAIGIGFFLAFWSWIGYEGTAIYGEEAEDPKKTIPRATYIAVITLGVFYFISAYASVVGFGSKAVTTAVENTGGYLFELAAVYTTPFIVKSMEVLTVTSFFACAFAFHNNASRYLFTFGREGILSRKLGRTHHKHKSPYIASNIQTILAAAIVLGFALAGRDPYLELATWVAAIATLSILVVQMLCSISVIGYFNRIGRDKGQAWKTIIAPAIGTVSFIIVIILLLNNLNFIAGVNMFVNLIPLYVAVVLVAGILYAYWLKKNRPELYNMIGHSVFEDK